MKFNLSKVMFKVMLSLGILMSISSNNWIMIWCGLEISLVSILPLMISESILSSESTMKYFIIQTISSSMLMLSLLTMIMKGDYNYEYMMMTALLIKMAVAPFHNWILTMIEGLEYNTIVIMLTINKIAPMTLVSYFNSKLNMVIIMTTIMGAMLGLNQNSIKKIILCSSIFNMGFMLVVIKYSLMWTYFLMVYSSMITMILMLLKKNKMNFMNQIIFSEVINTKLTFWMILLSMGGVPPLMGFSIKLMVMMFMISTKSIVMVSIMVITSLLVMFFYLRMTFMSIMTNSIIKKNKIFNLNNYSNWMITVNITSLPLLMLMKT